MQLNKIKKFLTDWAGWLLFPSVGQLTAAIVSFVMAAPAMGGILLGTSLVGLGLGFGSKQLFPKIGDRVDNAFPRYKTVLKLATWTAPFVVDVLALIYIINPSPASRMVIIAGAAPAAIASGAIVSVVGIAGVKRGWWKQLSVLSRAYFSHEDRLGEREPLFTEGAVVNHQRPSYNYARVLSAFAVHAGASYPLSNLLSDSLISALWVSLNLDENEERFYPLILGMLVSTFMLVRGGAMAWMVYTPAFPDEEEEPDVRTLDEDEGAPSFQNAGLMTFDACADDIALN